MVACEPFDSGRGKRGAGWSAPVETGFCQSNTS